MASVVEGSQGNKKEQRLALLHGERYNYNLPQGRHRERHFTAGETVRDIILGVSDGLTVPFALAAGLSGASASSSLVLVAGIAEIASGAVSMGLGGYLAAKSEADHYVRELKRGQHEIITVPDTEVAEIGEMLSEYGLEPDEYWPVVNALRRNPQAWVEFMMKVDTLEIVPLSVPFLTAFIGVLASAVAYRMAKAVQAIG